MGAAAVGNEVDKDPVTTLPARELQKFEHVVHRAVGAFLGEGPQKVKGPSPGHLLGIGPVRAPVGGGSVGVSQGFGSGQVIPYHPQGPAYRCSLPGLAGFAGVRRRGLGRQRLHTQAGSAYMPSRRAHGLHV